MLSHLFFHQLLSILLTLSYVASKPTNNSPEIQDESIPENQKNTEIIFSSPIIKLSLNNRKFFRNISEYQLFCVNSLPKTYENIWSSAWVSSTLILICLIRTIIICLNVIFRLKLNQLAIVLLRVVKAWRVFLIQV